MVSLEDQIDEVMRLIRLVDQGAWAFPAGRIAVLRAILTTLQSLVGPGEINDSYRD